jgi:hypothetical protein
VDVPGERGEEDTETRPIAEEQVMKQRPAYVRSRAMRFLEPGIGPFRPAAAARASDESTLVLWPSDEQTLVLKPTRSASMHDRVLAAFRRAFGRLAG